ncbi:hypothetical protein OF829_04155 [Sphingomonas sp. LB-2]|uniref:hypothetical protein n=1 Tax=Sphingomonas caeni TaxID=2984949 RepID=UPI00222ECF01|nr:hypothetical protein [Sphingomonas caeni]MCW3846420.1 hypothetical protein [Sphingomonas caeni]
MDYDLIGNAAIYGALASLAVASLGLGVSGRFSGGLALVIAIAAMALSGWVLVDWTHVTGAQVMQMLPRLGTIAGGALAGAVIGVILPLILNAIGEAMRGDMI